jgi:uncharacterized protein
MRFEFDWDPVKSETNLAKHRVSFEEAMAVFHDALALSRPDEDHGANEERWVTLGPGQDGRLGLVAHTYVEIDADRVISARRPTRRETRQYEEGASP